MKRLRERSFEYTVKDGYVVLDYDGKQYHWIPPKSIALDKFLNEDTYEYDIIKNRDGTSLFSVDNIRNNEHVFHQKINPLN